MSILLELTAPTKLWSRSEILARPSPAPEQRGLYAWYFKNVPAGVPAYGCHMTDGKTLLYAGISPKNETSTQSLKKRITTHFRGNAEGSTLRLSLGVLLCSQSNYPLRRVGSGKRKTFTHMGEQWLDNWMQQNAFVVWVYHEKPWEVEREIINGISLPLNIQHNECHEFSNTLSAMRIEAKKAAESQAIANEDNQQRSA